MHKWNRSIKNKVSRWNCGKLEILYVVGSAEQELEETSRLLTPGPWEVAPVQSQSQYKRDFLAAVHFFPAIDFTMDRSYTTSDSSIMAFSLNGEKMSDLVGKIIKESNFEPRNLRESDFDRVRDVLDVEFYSYLQAQAISQAVRGPVENAWSATRYANFLKMYKGLQQSDAVKKAAEKFQIKL